MVSAIPKKSAYYKKRGYFKPKRVQFKRKPSLAKRVNSLSKAVSLNRKLAYGHIQRNLQISSNTLVPTSTYPVCFQASNFSQGGTLAPFYQITTTGSIGQPAHFSSYDIVNNGFWAQSNQDIPDSGMYRALYANYRFQIEGNSSLDATRIRIDFLVPRPSSLRNATSSSQALVLPQALSALGGLCNYNMINPTYWKIIATRTVVIDSNTNLVGAGAGVTESTGHTSTTPNLKVCNFMLKLNKNMYQAASGTNFTYQNTAYANQVWCVISTDDEESTVSDSVNVKVTRHVVWRDSKGSSSL